MEPTENDSYSQEEVGDNNAGEEDEDAFLARVTASEVAAVEYLQGKGCLRKDVSCPVQGCGRNAMLFVNARGLCHFKCSEHKTAKDTVSVRKGSFWSRGIWVSNAIPFHTIIKINFSWCKQSSVEETSEELSVDPLVVRRAYMQLREVCQQWLEGDSYVIGGHGCEVHVELLDHQVGDGRKVKVLCGFCPRDDRGFVSYSSDLSDENVHSLLKIYVAPGSSILSNSWNGSSVVSVHPFVVGFKQRSQPNLARKYLTRLKNKQRDKCCGIALKYLNSHMSELMWREIHDTSGPITTMGTLLTQIAENHNVYDAVPALVEKGEKTETEDAIIHFPLPQDPEEAARIFSIINSEEAAITYLQEHKCVNTAQTCKMEGCNKVMSKYKEKNKKDYEFRCSRHRYQRGTLRKGTFWEGSHLTFTVSLKLLFCWAKATSVQDTAEIVGLTQGSVINYFKRLREACSAWLRKYPPLIGGTGKTVQLEIFDHRVDARKTIEERMVIGYSQADERGFARFTKRLSNEDIHNLVKAYVAPGSTIISTSWEDYASVQDIECDPAYEQGPYNRSKPSLAHDYWLKVKQTFGIGKSTGFGQSTLDLVCQEFIWRTVYGTQGPVKMMETMLSHLKELFPVFLSEQEQEIQPNCGEFVQVKLEGESSDDGPPSNLPSFREPEPVIQYMYSDEEYLRTAYKIVRSEDILTNEAILTERTNLCGLSAALEDEVSALEWCVKHR